MTEFLSKIFIKNSEDLLNPKVRKSYGTMTGAIGIICNIVLFIIKFIAGIITASISVTADAFNNLSDAGSSIITLIGFRMAEKPADNDHPYGHGRIEYISGLIIAIIIIVMGFELLKTSVNKILSPEPVEFSYLSLAILILSVLIKLWMALFNKKLGKKLNASAMTATAQDSFNDCIATFSVLICLLISNFTTVNIDGYAGAVVALFVLFSGYSTAKETLQPLLGRAPDPEFVNTLEKKLLSHEGINGIHDLIVHDYGPGRIIVSLHAEIPCDMNVVEAHDIIDDAEMDIKKNLNCEISIHMDPIATDDKRTNELKAIALEAVHKIDESMDIHDFRITDGPLRTNLIFDVAAPFDLKYSDNEIKNLISEKIKDINQKYYVVIEDVDRRSI